MLTFFQRLLCIAITMIGLLLVGVACNSIPFTDPESDEDVTLTFYDATQPGFELSMNEVTAEASDHLPHISFENKNHREHGSVTEMLRGSDIPDLSVIPIYYLPEVIDRNGELLFNFDHPDMEDVTQSIHSNLIENIRTQGEGQLLALPYDRNVFALLYNREIFALFQENDPSDGMTWDEVIELASRTSGERGETLYFGIQPVFFQLFLRDALSSQLSLAFVDADNESADFSDPAWTPFMEWWRDMKNIETYEIDYDQHCEDCLFTDGQAAMHFVSRQQDYFQHYPLMERVAEEHIDVVSFPVFADRPGIGPDELSHVLVVSGTSEHIEETMEVVSYLLSDDHQLENARLGIASPLDNDNMIEHFGADVPGTENKNLEAFFVNDPAPAPTYSDLEMPVKAHFTSTQHDTSLHLHDNLTNEQMSIESILQELELILNQQVLPDIIESR
jgi:ABC-type glycerol-3-phosphate transport system substrate-binding protein